MGYMVNTLSLFTGCGGIDIGLERAGFNVVGCIEIEKYACDTVRLNHPNKVVIGPPNYLGDIRHVDEGLLAKTLPIRLSEIEFIVGGPPCQPFSAASMQRYFKGDDKYKRKGFRDENLGTLLWEYFRVLKVILPKCFLVENVPDFVSGENKPEYDLFIKSVEELGYFTETKILLASDYGVPQNRKRAFIIGWKSDVEVEFSFPEPTHFQHPVNGQKPKIGIAQALFGIDTKCINHVKRNHKPESIERYKTLAVGKRESKGRVDRLNPRLPGKTVIAGGKNGGGRSHLHPYEARTLTPRESARIQTFPDNYILTGTIGRQFTQIGNAIPPLLGEVLGRKIAQSFFGKQYDGSPSLMPSSLTVEGINTICSEVLKQSDKSMLYNDLKGTK